MSGPRRRRLLRKALLHGLPLVLLAGLATTLGAALQVKSIHVTGTRAFPAADVERALAPAIGMPTIAARPEELRELALAVPWVADAVVRVTLDGQLTCEVRERAAAAVALDGSSRRLIDAEGRAVGMAGNDVTMLELVGFAGLVQERALLIARLDAYELAWGGRLRRAERIAGRDVSLLFDGSDCAIIIDPDRPASLADARATLVAWTAAYKAAPRRIDARVSGRLAVLPALPAPAGGETT